MRLAAIAAFVVAPAASASPVLTSEGKAVAVGAEIKGSNTGTFRFETSGYSVECPSVNMVAKLTANTGTHIGIEVGEGLFTSTGTGAGGDCTTNLGSAAMGEMCLTSIAKTDLFSVTGCGVEGVTMTTTITGMGACKYLATTITATFQQTPMPHFALTVKRLKRLKGRSTALRNSGLTQTST
jgi:hypothetical protein